MPFTPDSGPYTLAGELATLGIDASPGQVDEILRRAKAAMADEGRLLTDDDLARLAAEVVPGESREPASRR